MRIVTATPGLKGFDCNASLTREQAEAAKAKGYDFVMRYIPREAASGSDLSKIELRTLLDAGLMVGIVQHVHPGEWTASPELGARYGARAYAVLGLLAVPGGSPIWCDLEMVDRATPPDQTSLFVRSWVAQLEGYDRGLYVGFQPGLSADQLWALPIKRYWHAYNGDVVPTKRGFQLMQREATPADRIDHVAFPPVDVNIVQTDRLGDLPVFIGA